MNSTIYDVCIFPLACLHKVGVEILEGCKSNVYNYCILCDIDIFITDNCFNIVFLHISVCIFL